MSTASRCSFLVANDDLVEQQSDTQISPGNISLDHISGSYLWIISLHLLLFLKQLTPLNNNLAHKYLQEHFSGSYLRLPLFLK